MLDPGRRDTQHGSATVEFALVMPVLLVVMLAMVQVGLLARDRLLVSEAARAGAREAAVTDSEGDVGAAAARAAAALDPARLHVSVARSGGLGEPETVTVTYDAPLSVPFVSGLLPSSVSLSAAATMRQEFG